MEYSFQQHKINGGINADDEYWKGLEEGEFRLPRCSGCKTWMWPAHFRCAQCGSWDFDWIAVEPRGTIFTWTRSWYAFDRVAERTEDVPYVTVVAEIAEAGGARVMDVLAGSEDGLRIGAPVKGKIEPPSAKSKGYASITWTIDT